MKNLVSLLSFVTVVLSPPLLAVESSSRFIPNCPEVTGVWAGTCKTTTTDTNGNTSEASEKIKMRLSTESSPELRCRTLRRTPITAAGDGETQELTMGDLKFSTSPNMWGQNETKNIIQWTPHGFQESYVTDELRVEIENRSTLYIVSFSYFNLLDEKKAFTNARTTFIQTSFSPGNSIQTTVKYSSTCDLTKEP